MNKKIVIINGSGGVGKDTFCDLCSQNVSTINYSSVKEIKMIAQSFGWNGGKTEKDRKFLADLKLLSSAYNDFPYKCIKAAINNFYCDNNQLMFIHSRNIDEIIRLVNEYPNILTLLIRSNRVPVITTNIADANVEQYNYDYIIENNDGIEELYISSKQFLHQIFKK